MARVATYGLCVLTLGAGLAARSAYGHVKESALALGHELGKLDGAGSDDPILLNGQPIFVRSTIEDVGVDEVLDTVQAHCETNATGLRAELQDIAKAAKRPAPSPEHAMAAAGILREEAEDRGVVACLARESDDGRGGWEHFERFAESGDLSHVGNIRYVYAEKTKSGRTHVISVWTEGPFNLASMFPEKGDAPGTDAANAPRPGDGRRILSASIAGAPYGVRLYETPQPPEAVLEPYDRAMAERGWKAIVIDPEHHHRVYSRGDTDLIVSATPDGDGATVSVVESRLE